MSEYGFLPERQRSGLPPSEGGSAHEQIYAALSRWVERHPNPDSPALGVAGFGEYSPRELLAAVADRNELGQFFEAMIVHGANLSGAGLDSVLRSFRNESDLFRKMGAQSFDL